MKMRLMRSLGLAVLVLGAALTTAVGESYFLKSATNMPPMPFNAWPGYPTATAANGVTIVDDTVSDARVLSRGLMMMETDEGPPPFGGGGTNTDTGDTNAWMGTFIHGYMGPQDATNGLPASRDPCLWTILCTNNSYSEIAHELIPWQGITRVCPNDRVAVLWPFLSSTFKAGWPCFSIIQRGTNSSGTRWTKVYLATMDNALHEPGNWAMWTIPAWPTVFPNLIVTNECMWYTTNTYCICSNNLWTTNYAIIGEPLNCSLLPPQDIFTDTGPTIVEGTNGVPGGMPNRPINIGTGMDNQGPPQGPWCEIVGLDWRPWKSLPGIVTLPVPTPECPCADYYPPKGESETHVTNYFLHFSAHGLPGQAYIVQSSTNLINWVQEGGTNVTFPSEGSGLIYIGRTNKMDIPPSLFLRLRTQ